ncbi:MAG TPA: glucose 1-dehydrogenase [Thermoanaerobaculia bacterium]|nr:glucose 1-dehydrogenase [Thermoanaerobaculia bacterium]
MKALAIVPGTKSVSMVDRPKPAISRPDEIELQVLRVGICGTDREEVAGGRALAPEGQTTLVIGHEMIGRVTAVGSAVRRVRPGDFAAFTVRRGCGRCLPCAMNRSDMCATGDYRERGIWGLDGYQAESAVDTEQYVVRVPPELGATGVLTEPMSVAGKAIDEAVRVQAGRLPDAVASPNWLSGRRCLVAGLGPIGLLAALALRLRGAEVHGLDVVDPTSARPRWLEKIGGTYLDARKVDPDQLGETFGMFALIFDATGVAPVEFNVLDALDINGVYVLTGIPGGDRPIELPGATLIRQLVLRNQVMLGSVNASRGHFQQAVDDLMAAQLRWGDAVGSLITHRHPSSDFAPALEHHEADEIKVVIDWASA